MEITFEKLDLSTHQLIDIREEYERAGYAHSKALHIPMANLVEEAENLDKEVKFVVHCASGNRSLNVVKMLHAKGFTNFESLAGGAGILQMHNE